MKNPIQQIHILKNRLARKGVPSLSEETYRALLQESYQVNSSKDLNTSQQKEQGHDVRSVDTHTMCKSIDLLT